jgi:High potential iron-sulfur protein
MSIDKQAANAGIDAPRKPAEVSRRNLLRDVTVIAGGAAVFAAGMTATCARADSGKVSQATAGYQATAKNGQQCDSCSLFQAPSSCSLVDGSVSPTGWCKFYAKKS